MSKPLRNLQPFRELEVKYSHRGLMFTSLEAKALSPTCSLYGHIDNMIFDASFRGCEAHISMGYSYSSKHYWEKYYESYQKWLDSLSMITTSFETGKITEDDYIFNYQMVYDLEPKLVLPKDDVAARVDVSVLRSSYFIPGRTAKPPWRRVDEVEVAKIFEILLANVEMFTLDNSEERLKK